MSALYLLICCRAVAAGKKGKGLEVKTLQAKNFLCLFVNCLVENPAFDSQVSGHGRGTNKHDTSSHCVAAPIWLGKQFYCAAHICPSPFGPCRPRRR